MIAQQTIRSRNLVFQGAQSGSFWLWLCIVVATAVVVVMLLRAERRLVPRSTGLLLLLLRLGVLVVLLLTALRPVMSWHDERDEDGVIVVALDISQSMSTADKQASRSEKLRWARALGMYGNKATEGRIDRWLAALDRGEEPEWVESSESLDPERKSELAAARKENLEGVFRELGRLTRSEIAARLLTGTQAPLLERLQKVGRVQLRVFAGGSEDADDGTLRGFIDEPPASIGAGLSDLSEALTTTASPLLGIVLLSDGRDTTNKNPAKVAEQLSDLGAPVCPIVLGSVRRPRDVAVTAVEAPQTVFLKDNATLSAVVLASGVDEDLTVVLEREGEIAAERTVRAVDGGIRVDFNLETEQVGRHKYRLRVRPVTDETREDNNETDVALTVVDDRARVLLVEGESRWEFRFLHRALERDERAEAASVVFHQPYLGQLNSTFFPRKLNLPEAADIDDSPLADVDVVVIGDVSPTDLSAPFLQLLERYVSDFGGTVVFQAGKRYMPLEHKSEILTRLLPVRNFRIRNLRGLQETGPPRDRGMHVSLTSDGAGQAMFQFVEGRDANRKFWLSLPGHLWAIVAEAKPGAAVFGCVADPTADMNTDYEQKNALIARQFYGFGQVVWIGFDSTWRWRFREGDRFHHRFWGQLCRWAAANKASAGDQRVRLKLSDTELKQGDDLTLTALWSQQQLQQQPESRARAVVTRKGADGDEPFSTVPLEPEPGRRRSHSARLLSLPAGTYEVELEVNGQIDAQDPIKAEFFVRPEQSKELADVSSNRRLLQEIADASGGRLFQADETAGMAEIFRRDRAKQTRSEDTPLWDHWSVLLVFLSLLTIEWVIRKLSGLP